jgi:hypothetical protein
VRVPVLDHLHEPNLARSGAVRPNCAQT